MQFNWVTNKHGKCLVSARLEAEQTSVLISWGKSDAAALVEYRIVNLPTQDQQQRLEAAIRFAMGHFEGSTTSLPLLVNLSIDGTSAIWEGSLPRPVAGNGAVGDIRTGTEQ